MPRRNYSFRLAESLKAGIGGFAFSGHTATLAFRTALASILSILVAMILHLDNPYWTGSHWLSDAARHQPPCRHDRRHRGRHRGRHRRSESHRATCYTRYSANYDTMANALVNARSVPGELTLALSGKSKA